MSDEQVKDVEDPQSSGDVQELSRKEKAAARRAEFEAAKEAKAAAKAEQQAAKNAEKAAATAAAREEKLAAKKAQDEIRAAAKAAKEAKRVAKKEAKAAARTEKDIESGDAASKSGSKEKKEKTEKDPYRPRFAVAPGKVRVFTVLAAVLAVLYGTLAALLVFASASSSVLAYAAAAGALLVAVLWVVSASLLCAGRVQGKYLGVVVLVLGLPLSLVAAPLLFSDDVRSWAL
jgi:hypothetical protein